jgi:hypothetical protein
VTVGTSAGTADVSDFQDAEYPENGRAAVLRWSLRYELRSGVSGFKREEKPCEFS